MNRVVWLDYGKAIAIFLVVFAHTALYKPLETFIYTFHIPFFFFISGCLFSFERYPCYKDFVIKRFKQLILPYIAINVITYLFWFFVSSRVGADADTEVAYSDPLLAALLVDARGMLHDVPLWFLPALFITENIYYLLFKRVDRRWIAFLFLIVVVFVNEEFGTFEMPFSIDAALPGTVFYAIGCELRKKPRYAVDNPVFFTISFLILLLAVVANGRVAMHVAQYNNMLLFILGGIAGSLVLMYICTRLQNFLERKKSIEFIAMNTLLICGFHLPVFTCMKGFMLYAMGISPDSMNGTIFANAVFSVVAIALCLMLSALINRCLKKIL